MTAFAARIFHLMAATLIIWTRPHPIRCRYRIWICIQRTYITICSTMQQLRPIQPPQGISIQSINCILCKTHISIQSNEIEAVCHLQNMLNGNDLNGKSINFIRRFKQPNIRQKSNGAHHKWEIFLGLNSTILCHFLVLHHISCNNTHLSDGWMMALL